jgi:hypothetical protein
VIDKFLAGWPHWAAINLAFHLGDGAVNAFQEPKPADGSNLWRLIE